jgi:ketosteroid isomerase-like protein
MAIPVACTQSVSPDNDSSTDQADILKLEEEVKATLVKMWEAIENEDIELYASYIHPDFTQFGESDPTLSIGKEMEVNGIREWIRNSSNIHTEMEEPIVVIRDSVAWIVYYWKDNGSTNGDAFSSRGKSTRIFVKEEGRWLCIHGHYTLLP